MRNSLAARQPGKYLPHLAQATGLLLLGCVANLCWGAVPIFNSDYRASHVLYLDFDGHYQPMSSYQCDNGQTEGWPVDFSTTDVSTSLDEAQIRKIWEAVAEDFAPFDVNVTTDARNAPEPYASNGARIAIGVSSLGGLGHAPPICYGDYLANPAYLNGRIANVAVVNLLPPLANEHLEMAKRISHEAGHLYGLAHHVAPPGALSDWIMAPQRRATRFIWRDGTNEFGEIQNDTDQLAYLLGRRDDEPQPMPLDSSGAVLANQPANYHAHATMALAGDSDDLLFTPGKVGSFEVRLWPGVWTSPSKPSETLEPNARYRLSILSADGSSVLLCPTTNPFRVSVADRDGLSLDCSVGTNSLTAWSSYRIRVDRDSTTTLPGNIGRYTVTVKEVTSGWQFPDEDPDAEPNPPPDWIDTQRSGSTHSQ